MKNTTIQNLVLKYFTEICRIPHTTGNEKALATYVATQLEKFGAKVQIDKVGNVYAIKQGNLKVASVCLQAHLDMVGVKTPESHHDFSKDPIKYYEENGWIKARDTTLGADNGIGIAMILAAFANGADTHGQLEAIFTIQEETTTYGAKHLPKGIIKSKYFINLDNEHDASVVVGSCFSNEFIGNVKIIRTTSSSDTCNMIIKLGGGHSGHSGNDIHKKIININVELFNMLKTLRTKYEFSILDVKTGSVTNSIPGECSVIIHTKHKIISNIKKTLLIQTNLLKETLPSYNKIMLTVESTFSKLKPLKLSDSDKLIHLVCAANNGLNRYNFERSVTELSTNLAIIKLQDATASIVWFQRSQTNYFLDEINNKLISLFALASGEWKIQNRDIGLKDNGDNILTRNISQIAMKKFNHKMDIIQVHGAIEIAEIMKNNTSVIPAAIGPNIVYPHTTNECVEIKSIMYIYALLQELLKSLK